MQSIDPKAQTAQSQAPLLRSIAREIVERTAAIARLQATLEELAAAPRADVALAADLTASLASQRRELRFAEEELGRLGWSRDARRLLAFVRSGEGSEETWELAGTGFHGALSDLSA